MTAVFILIIANVVTSKTRFNNISITNKSSKNAINCKKPKNHVTGTKYAQSRRTRAPQIIKNINTNIYISMFYNQFRHFTDIEKIAQNRSNSLTRFGYTIDF
jgi:hypothetical protein